MRNNHQHYRTHHMSEKSTLQITTAEKGCGAVSPPCLRSLLRSYMVLIVPLSPLHENLKPQHAAAENHLRNFNLNRDNLNQLSTFVYRSSAVATKHRMQCRCCCHRLHDELLLHKWFFCCHWHATVK